MPCCELGVCAEGTESATRELDPIAGVVVSLNGTKSLFVPVFFFLFSSLLPPLPPRQTAALQKKPECGRRGVLKEAGLITC